MSSLQTQLRQQEGENKLAPRSGANYFRAAAEGEARDYQHAAWEHLHLALFAAGQDARKTFARGP